MSKTIPNELQNAVETVNSWKRDLGNNPALIKIEFCVDCGEAYPSLPEDAAVHTPRCRECAPAHKRQQAAARRKASRAKAKAEKVANEQ